MWLEITVCCRWTCVVPPLPARQIPVYTPQQGRPYPTITVPNACIIHQVDFHPFPVPVSDMELDLSEVFQALIFPE